MHWQPALFSLHLSQCLWIQVVTQVLRHRSQSFVHCHLEILNSNIGFNRRYCLRARIRWAIEEARDRKLYVELNRYLARIIAELPLDVAKMTAGGWITRRANRMCGQSLWQDQLFVLRLLADLKRWYTMVHERYPEFDMFLFDGTGLFKDKPSVLMKNGTNERASIPIRRPRRKTSSSHNSWISREKSALDMAISLFRQFPPTPSSRSKHT